MTKTCVDQSELVNVGAQIDQLSIYKRLGFIVRMALKNDFCLCSPLENMKRKKPVMSENHL